MTATKTFQMRCPSCWTMYVVRCPQKMTLKSIIADGARCIEVRTSSLCGAPLQRTQNVFNNGRDARFLDYTELLGYRVTRVGLLDDAQTAKAAAQAKQDYDEKIARLQSEVIRLTTKYETPCEGLVLKIHESGDRRLDQPVKCGGFMGHHGQCAEVW